MKFYGNSHGNTKWRFRARALRTSSWQKFFHLAFDQGQGHCSPGISYFGKVSTKREKQCMHQLIEDKGSSDGGCDRVRLRLQCLACAARLRRSSALPGPWSIVDNKNLKCKSAALFSLLAFTEGRQRKVTSRLRKLVFSEWDRGCLQHVARAYSLDLHPVHVLVHFYKTNIELLDEVLRWTCCRPR